MFADGMTFSETDKGQTKELQDASQEAYTMMVPTVMRKMQAANVSTPAVQSEALRCWALVHGLACFQLSGNLSACLGGDLSKASESELLDLVGGLLE